LVYLFQTINTFFLQVFHTTDRLLKITALQLKKPLNEFSGNV